MLCLQQQQQQDKQQQIGGSRQVEQLRWQKASSNTCCCSAACSANACCLTACTACSRCAAALLHLSPPAPTTQCTHNTTQRNAYVVILRVCVGSGPRCSMRRWQRWTLSCTTSLRRRRTGSTRCARGGVLEVLHHVVRAHCCLQCALAALLPCVCLACSQQRPRCAHVSSRHSRARFCSQSVLVSCSQSVLGFLSLSFSLSHTHTLPHYPRSLSVPLSLSLTVRAWSSFRLRTLCQRPSWRRLGR